MYPCSFPLCCLFCLVVEQKENSVLQLHVLKVGRNSVAECIHHQICMNTVYQVKIFSFVPSCVAPIETGGVGVNSMLNGCTRLGNPESHVVWANLAFLNVWASHCPYLQPHSPLFLIQLRKKSTKSYNYGYKPWENQIASTEMLTHVHLEGQRVFFFVLFAAQYLWSTSHHVIDAYVSMLLWTSLCSIWDYLF